MVGLWDARDRAGFALSSGMRARLMLARAILHEPKVLILDEPTGSIDPIGAQFLKLIIKITVEQETATLVSSHRLEEIEDSATMCCFSIVAESSSGETLIM